MKKSFFHVTILVSILFVTGCVRNTDEVTVTEEAAADNTLTNLNSEMINETPQPNKTVVMKTNKGDITIELFNETMPITANNFLKLAQEDFYDSVIFHRVIDGFMIQGGDPDGIGSGGPGYTIPAEFVDSLVHFKGALAAARQGDAVNPEKASSGSQFYIVQGRPVTNEMLNNLENQKNKRYTQDQREKYAQLGGTPFLDREYTVFGKVIKGLDIIDKIAKSPLGKNDRPIKDVKMKMRLIH